MILDCNEILPDRLWVGRFVRIEEVPLLKQLEITSVVSLQSDEDLAYYNISLRRILKAYAAAGIDFRRAATRDFDRAALASNLPECVTRLTEALEPRWARVYLHCTAGINRAPTTAAAYLIRTRQMSAQEAYDFVTSRRQCSPFLGVLEQYEEALHNRP